MSDNTHEPPTATLLARLFGRHIQAMTPPINTAPAKTAPAKPDPQGPNAQHRARRAAVLAQAGITLGELTDTAADLHRCAHAAYSTANGWSSANRDMEDLFVLSVKARQAAAAARAFSRSMADLSDLIERIEAKRVA